MTFDEATRYIYKICRNWVRTCRRSNFEVDELFNEVWMGFGGDCSRFGEDYALMGLVANRHIIRYVKAKDGNPGSYRYRGIRDTERLGDRFGITGTKSSPFANIDDRDECEYLLSCLTLKQKFILQQYFAGRKMESIGRQFGIKRTSVCYYVSRALDTIRCENKGAA